MDENTGPIECAICGAALGIGITDGERFCLRCAKYVVTRAREFDWGSIAVAAIALGLGLFFGWFLGRGGSKPA